MNRGTIHWRYTELKTLAAMSFIGTMTVGDMVRIGTLLVNPRYPALGSEPEFDVDRLSARVKTDSIRFFRRTEIGIKVNKCPQGLSTTFCLTEL